MPWTFEVLHGRLDTLPKSVADGVTAVDGTRGCCLLLEAGALLNEADVRSVVPVADHAAGLTVLAKLAEALLTLVEQLEVQADGLGFLYWRCSFVNNANRHAVAESDTWKGQFTTNASELRRPSGEDQSLATKQFAIAARLFLSHVRASIEDVGFETQLYGCDWVTLSCVKGG